MNDGQDIRIMVVDDHAIVLDGLKTRINAQAGMRVVAMADNADAAVRLAREHGPDIIVMDVEMPGLDPFSATRDIYRFLPDTRMVFFSALCHDFVVEQAVKARAWGYICKAETSETIIEALLKVAAGGVFFSSAIKSRVVASPDGLKLTSASSTCHSLLSPREIETLRYVAQGLSTKEIAELMSLSVKTVENHRTRLMSKLDIHDRVHLTRYAIREGIVIP